MSEDGMEQLTEQDLGSCTSDITHYCTFLSGALFFGCEPHVDELLKMRVAQKKKVSRGKI